MCWCATPACSRRTKWFPKCMEYKGETFETLRRILCNFSAFLWPFNCRLDAYYGCLIEMVMSRFILNLLGDEEWINVNSKAVTNGIVFRKSIDK